MTPSNTPSSSEGRIGRYLIRRELGRGGMGVVYLAEDPHLGRDVAIKVIRTDLSDSPAELEEMSRRFEAEAKAGARLHHNGIVPIHDSGDHNGQKFIVMSYIKGTRVSELVGKLQPREALSIVHQVAAALDHAHSKHVIHRDIKPSNIMVESDGTAKIMDFGVAKIHVTGFTLTSAGLILGTAPYMSPEQITGQRPVEGPADRWSLAVTAYEALTGTKPFNADDFGQLRYLICEGLPQRQLNPALPENVYDVFRRALSKSLDDRYSSCQKFAEALSASYSAVSADAGVAVQPSISPETLFADANRQYYAGNFEEAFQKFRSAAQGGHPEAMYNLGMLYENGCGVRRDFGHAMDWYTNAAEAGVVTAMNRVGLMYEQGTGCLRTRVRPCSGTGALLPLEVPRLSKI